MTEKKNENIFMFAIMLAAVLLIFNQVQISAISEAFGGESVSGAFTYSGSSGSVELSSVDVTTITSTPMAVASVFPELNGMKDSNEIMNFMVPSGTPEYSEVMGGITFDDPVSSMEYLAKWFRSLSQEVRANDMDTWKRYVAMASEPRGVSCEYCCGLGATGADKNGNSVCGCKHNPALLGLTLGLMKNTDYTDAEVLREVMKWKTMFFPKNMVEVAMQVAGTDPSELQELPGMVGGC
jgi:hypothetical protein